MDAYHHDHAPKRHMIGRILLISLIAGLGIGLIISIIALDSARHKQSVTQGAAISVPQNNSGLAMITMDEPLFKLQLPSDWKQISSTATSVTWQATRKNADNRTLTVYTDDIPTTMPISRELPITVNGNQLNYGEQSDNCINFTSGGTQDVSQAAKLKPVLAAWDGINFICNLPQVVNNQVVGTGSAAGINTFVVTGPAKGSHKYFFLYTDLNIQPDYTILNGAIQSFRAK